VKCIFYGNRPFCVFETPLGDLGTTYDDHLRLIGKRVVDFLLALIELFSLHVTAEALRAIIGSKSTILAQRGPIDPKFQVEGVAPTNHSSSQKTRLKDLSYDIKSGPIFLSFCQRSRVWQTDRLTDGRTEFSLLDRVCISWSAVKTDACRPTITEFNTKFDTEIFQYFHCVWHHSQTHYKYKNMTLWGLFTLTYVAL